MLAYRPEIDGLRAIAIVSVVLFHAGSAIFPGGYVGVDIFFVISGFLITSIIAKDIGAGQFSYVEFYGRRARRILPALLFLVLTITVIAFRFYLPSALVEYGKTLIYTLLFGANFRFASTPGYFAPIMQDNVFLHMWSLAVEEQFYLVWPPILMILSRLAPGRTMALIVAGLGVLSLVASEILVNVWPRSAFFHLPSRGWELMVGAVLALGFVPRIRTARTAELSSAAGVAMMIAPMFLYDRGTPFPGVLALPPVLGCALVIHASTHARTLSSRILGWTPIAFIGLISYSLYLWHWPIFALAPLLTTQALAPASSFFCIGLSVLAAILSWRFVEQPFRRRRLLPLRPLFEFQWIRIPRFTRAGYAALGLTGALVACGSLFQETAGAPWRLPEATRKILPQGADLDHFGDCSKLDRPKSGRMECSFGNGSNDVILWGDSHAMHYLPAVASVYKNGRAFMGLSCLPLPGVRYVNPDGVPIDPNCALNNDRTVSEILRYTPRVVVLAGRWTFSEDLPYGNEIRPYGFLIRTAADARTRENSREVFATGLSDIVETLTRAGIKVVLLGQAPEMKLAVTSCLAKASMTNAEDGACRSISRAEVERRQFYVNRALDHAAAGNANVFVFHPIPHLCNSELCHAVQNGDVFYFDNDHIRRAAALWLAQFLESELPDQFKVPQGDEPSARSMKSAGG